MLNKRLQPLLVKCTRQTARGLLLALFVFQGLIPAGTMPVSSDSGWLLQICPDGLSPAAMAMLHGNGDFSPSVHGASASHHHDHSSHGDAGSHGASAVDCDFANLVLDLAAPGAAQADVALAGQDGLVPCHSSLLNPPDFLRPQSRAPPLQSVS